ncbi:MAG: hypothetical protein SWK90_09100 [Chloroflexota bacterium]|nr:hypothetical protein [Chloroflexota bacterium]
MGDVTKVQLERLPLPHTGLLQVDIHLSAQINMTATMARRRVSRVVISEIGNLLYGGEPSLVVGDHIQWRVPVMLAYPDTGSVGEVGALDVDVETGMVLASPERLQEIADRAHHLAQRTSHSPA